MMTEIRIQQLCEEEIAPVRTISSLVCDDIEKSLSRELTIENKRENAIIVTQPKRNTPLACSRSNELHPGVILKFALSGINGDICLEKPAP